MHGQGRFVTNDGNISEGDFLNLRYKIVQSMKSINNIIKWIKSKSQRHL